MSERPARYDDRQDFNGLNPREWMFANAIAEGKTGREAAIAAGWSPRRAGQTASEKLADVKTRTVILRALEAKGFTLEGIGGKLAELLNTKSHAVTKDGRVVELGPDGATQVKAMDLVLKVADAYPNPRLDVNANIAATVVVRSEDQLASDPFADVIDVTPEDA